MNKTKEKLIIFSAPSGSGKTSIVKEIMQRIPEFKFSVSATTRPKRGTETDKEDYYFLNPDEFKEKIANNEFVEWEEVYKNRFYGTLKSEIERIWAKGKYVVFDVDVKGGLNLKKYYGEKALAIFVQVPSIEVLEERLRNRATDSEADIQARLNKAEYEMTFAPEFDEIIVNDKLERSVEDTYELITDFLAQ